MPTSEQQIQANRQNAQQSTGPSTPEGKQTSSRNALTHGILAREVVISHPGYQENEAEFDTLLSQLHDDWQPDSPREELLLQQITVCSWRLRRILQADSLEFGKTLAQLQEPADTMDSLGKTVTLYPPSLPPAERLDLILRYEKSLTQQFFRAMKELEHLQGQRRQSGAASPPTQPLDDPAASPCLVSLDEPGTPALSRLPCTGEAGAGAPDRAAVGERVSPNEPISDPAPTPSSQETTHTTLAEDRVAPAHTARPALSRYKQRCPGPLGRSRT